MIREMCGPKWIEDRVHGEGLSGMYSLPSIVILINNNIMICW